MNTQPEGIGEVSPLPQPGPTSQPTSTSEKTAIAISNPSAPNHVYPKVGELVTSLGTKNTYTFGEQIGEGNFALVFECSDSWENQLAAKVLKPLGTYESVRESAEREARKLVELRHPNITYVYDAFEFRNTFYIITERCHSSLEKLLSAEWFHGPTWLLPIARCILQAIQYLHTAGYVHLDLHAGNVFAAFAKDEMDPENSRAMTFKVGDLGIAQLHNAVGLHNLRPNWLHLPEILRPEEFGPIDSRQDMYLAGLLLLQIALSKPLTFSPEDVLAGKPRELALTLPAPYNFALEKCLRRRVQYRTATAMELWRDLRAPSSMDTRPRTGLR